MAEITASLVKTLRERTQAGMMDCKKYLVKAEGDLDRAEELMRAELKLKAAKKAGRTAAEGIVAVRTRDGRAVALELNSETDFVAKGDDFIDFANRLADVALDKQISDVAVLMDESDSKTGQSFSQSLQDLVAKLGENIQPRRIALMDAGNGQIAHYQHGSRIAVLVRFEGGDDALGKDLAMHIAASRPEVITPDQVPLEIVNRERGIYEAQQADSNKPENIREKIVQGQLDKFLRQISLVGQDFVKNPDLTVEKLLKEHQAKVHEFIRIEVGEGIEKKEENFRDEVMAQARGTAE